ncbi:MAG: nickel-dependent hydrogenase large subunit, partial [Chthoniobacterales bacterium]|nr:nickel-dependent hydrogenase large subunit [Chthoniobacterales bacterium]
MSKILDIDPVTRIEGHLAVRVQIENGVVTDAFCSGEMFRGFEEILRGRHPLDAQQITQRICGVCPIEHGVASALAQDDAYRITPARNGVLERNIVQAANYLHSHIIHFYGLCGVDFLDVTAILDYKGNDGGMQQLRDWVQKQIDSKVYLPA